MSIKEETPLHLLNIESNGDNTQRGSRNMSNVDLAWPDQARIRGFRAPIVELGKYPSVVRHDLANQLPDEDL